MSEDIHYVLYQSWSEQKDLQNFVEDVNNILQHARANNPKYGIRGLMLTTNFFYLQFIEGPKDQVNKLYKNIQKDSRHHSIQTIYDGKLDNYLFDKWSMALVDRKDIQLQDNGLLESVVKRQNFLPETQHKALEFIELCYHSASDKRQLNLEDMN